MGDKVGGLLLLTSGRQTNTTSIPRIQKFCQVHIHKAVIIYNRAGGVLCSIGNLDNDMTYIFIGKIPSLHWISFVRYRDGSTTLPLRRMLPYPSGRWGERYADESSSLSSCQWWGSTCLAWLCKWHRRLVVAQLETNALLPALLSDLSFLVTWRRTRSVGHTPQASSIKRSALQDICAASRRRCLGAVEAKLIKCTKTTTEIDTRPFSLV